MCPPFYFGIIGNVPISMESENYMTVTESYATAICGDGTDGTVDFGTLTSKVNEIAKKHGIADGLLWGSYDVWNDYNKIVLRTLDELRAEGEESGFNTLYAGVVFPGDVLFLRTFSTGAHYSVHYNEVPHMEIIYDDYAEISYDESTPWGKFVAEVLGYLRENVPQD